MIISGVKKLQKRFRGVVDNNGLGNSLAFSTGGLPGLSKIMQLKDSKKINCLKYKNINMFVVYYLTNTL